jgi:prevent-host-death family protein
MTVSVDAKVQLSELLKRVEAGEEVVLTHGGVPVARLLPVKEKRKLGFVEGRVPDEFFDPLPEEELKAWEGS